MTNLILPRRKFITGLVSLMAAPAIVRASSLMPVKVVIDPWINYTVMPLFPPCYIGMMININNEIMEITGINNVKYYK